MKRYNKYKDSGIPWLGQIPEHWEMRRLGLSFKENRMLNSDLVSTEVYKFNYGNLIRKDEGLDLQELKDVYIKYTRLQKNDIVINGLNLNYDFVSQRVAIAPRDGIITSAYLVLSPRDGVNYNYYCMLLKAMDSMKLFHGMGSGIRLTLSYNDLKNTHLPLPPLSEQAAIVSYLDRKVSELDSFVSKQEAQISYLKELKQATIAKAVTRGVDPSVALKDSGIPWLGQIPEHWEVRKMREVIEIYSDKGYPNATLLSVVRERGVVIRDTESKEENHNYIPTDLSGYKRVQRGDFVINKMKAWQGSYGVSDYEGIVSPAYYTCKLRCPNKSFFHLAIRSKAYVPFFTQYSKGIRVGQWDLSPVDLKSIPFIAPPPLEQAAIVSYLEEKLGAIDRLIAASEAAIARVRELKQTLIADVVTGRICVQSS